MRREFDVLVKRLQKTNLKLRVKMELNEIIVECGFNYPDEIAEKIFEISDELLIDVTVCAEQTGGKILNSELINGGPKIF